LGYTVSSHRSRAIRKSRPSRFDSLQKKVGSWVLPHLVAVFGQRQLGSGSWCDNKHGIGDTSGWRGGVQRGKGAEFDGPGETFSIFRAAVMQGSTPADVIVSQS